MGRSDPTVRPPWPPQVPGGYTRAWSYVLRALWVAGYASVHLVFEGGVVGVDLTHRGILNVLVDDPIVLQ
jgi:hypothetical protein